MNQALTELRVDLNTLLNAFTAILKAHKIIPFFLKAQELSFFGTYKHKT